MISATDYFVYAESNYKGVWGVLHGWSNHEAIIQRNARLRLAEPIQDNSNSALCRSAAWLIHSMMGKIERMDMDGIL